MHAAFLPELRQRQSAQWKRNLAEVHLLEHNAGVQAAEAGRIYSGVYKTDLQRGPKLRALNNGYIPGHHSD